MIGEECVNSCIQPHAKNIWKTQKEVAEHNAKATIPNSASILGPQGNVTTIDASEYISRAQGASKPHLRRRNQVQLHELQINNKLWSKHKTWLTLPTQYTTATHQAPSPTHYHTPPAPQYLTTHQTTAPLYHNPPSLHAIPYTTSPSSTPTQSLHPPQTSALAPQTHYPTFPRIVIPPQQTSALAPQTHYPTSIPHPTPQYPGWVPANDTKGHNCEWPYFFYGKWCTMYNNNWTTWCRWRVQLQLPGANQLIRNNQLQHPGTQHKETKAQSIQLISELANNENTLTITLKETHLN